MREIIRRGTFYREVIDNYLNECNLQESELEIVVEHKGSKGFFSLFGKKEAVVKFIIPDVQDRIHKYLKTLLKYLAVSYKDIEIKQDKSTYHTHIKGVDNPGFLIGKEGKMLESIELLLNKIVDDKEHKDDNVILDIDNYRKRSNINNTNHNDAKSKHVTKVASNVKHSRRPSSKPNVRKKRTQDKNTREKV